MLKYQGAIPTPLFDLAVVIKMRSDYYADVKKSQSALMFISMLFATIPFLYHLNVFTEN